MLGIFITHIYKYFKARNFRDMKFSWFHEIKILPIILFQLNREIKMPINIVDEPNCEIKMPQEYL